MNTTQPTLPKIIVLDDDPTGSQTVHSCLLLTQWDIETLKLGLIDEAPIFFILTNTRALTPTEADQVTTEVCHNLKIALKELNITNYLIVSRSDSTLRGHYPIETDAIAAELGSFDGHFLLPAFFEGGRFTRDSVHYLVVNGVPTPVHQTEFAKDSVFAYSHSYLPDYVEEKTQGKIPANQVVRFLLPEIRQGCLEKLLSLSNNTCGVVDGEQQEDFDRFAQDLLTASSLGKKFLLRSAASILTSLANLGSQPIPSQEMYKYVRGEKSGIIIVGSHVQKSTNQLNQLLTDKSTSGIEINVGKLLESPTSKTELLTATINQIYHVQKLGLTPVVYTSRQELTFVDVQTRLDFGKSVSGLLMDIVRQLPVDIGWLISKGGITSNDVLSSGLALPTARLLGQILPGCSLVITPSNHSLYPNLPVVLFPGNVGDDNGLLTVYQRLKSPVN
jgi:uncharacterized protein YgbK (DUF1537 family)